MGADIVLLISKIVYVKSPIGSQRFIKWPFQPSIFWLHCPWTQSVLCWDYLDFDLLSFETLDQEILCSFWLWAGTFWTVVPAAWDNWPSEPSASDILPWIELTMSWLFLPLFSFFILSLVGPILTLACLTLIRTSKKLQNVIVALKSEHLVENWTYQLSAQFLLQAWL